MLGNAQKKSILLIQPMHEKMAFNHKKVRTSIHFPWGLAYLAETIKRSGHPVSILDGQALQLEKEELALKIDQFDADIIGISAFSTQFNAVRYLSRYVKEKDNRPVIVGGPMATYQPEFTLLQTDTDVCVIGDGEITAVDLLNNWDNKSQVEGIVYKDNGKIHHTPLRMLFPILDDLPMPDFSMFDMDKYLTLKNSYAGRVYDGVAMSVATARGCPYRCHFCSLSTKSYRNMSSDKIQIVLQELKQNFHMEEAIFQDELFLTSKKRFGMLAPMLQSLDIQWSAQGRINVVDHDFLELAKSVGCVGIGYGVESGSQKILDNMNKKITVAQIENALTLTKKAGISMKVQLMFAYVGEDEQTVQETVDLMRRVDLPGRRMTVATPIPGSPLYDECMANNRIKDEAKYLTELEKSFGHGKILVNLTQWPDDEIYPRKKAAEKQMDRNFIDNNWKRKVRYFLTRRINKKQ